MATLSELVSSALQSSRQIESSDRAYFELSTHEAGYQTPDLKELNVRQDELSQSINWTNQWTIKAQSKNNCLENDWENGFSPSICGKINSNQKLKINLFNDIAQANNVDKNQIGTEKPIIERLNLNQLEIKFRLPKDLVNHSDLTELEIDNDEDYDKITGEGFNEDGEKDGTNTCNYSGNTEVNDNDCDQRENEDSPEDPVFIWKAIDENGRSFQPLRGCKDDDPHPDHNAQNAGLCEKNFSYQGNDELSVSLNINDEGWTSDGAIQSFFEFINDTDLNSPLQMEVLLVVPMVAIKSQNPPEERQIAIPYFEYGIVYDAGFQSIPDAFFTIQSDGYFRDFKQSITTRVMPGQVTRLLDLTVIQQ